MVIKAPHPRFADPLPAPRGEGSRGPSPRVSGEKVAEGRMRGRTALIVVIALLAACSKPVPPTPPPPIVPRSDADERVNLLNFAHGATVVSRTGELSLGESALAAIDGNPATSWTMVPDDLPQSVVVALPARSRIEQIGVRSGPNAQTTAKTVVFESSLDGVGFHPLGTASQGTKGEPRLVNVPVTEASFIRATITEGGKFARIASLQARGRELEPPQAGAIDGCWTVNGRAAAFARHGDRVTGFIETATVPILLDGDTDGRVYRFLWTRGPELGYAAISVSPDGKHLSGAQWHEEPVDLFFGTAWFGERGACTKPVPSTDAVAQSFLAHGRLPLYALHSGETLRKVAAFVSGRDVQLIGHEFREGTTEANRRRAAAELAWLKGELGRLGAKIDRVSFVTAGSENPRQYPASDAVRALYSTIDLEPALRR